MKLTTVLLIATCLQVSARGYSQKVTIKENNSSLQKVFERIRKQTGFQFFYADEMLANTKSVSLNFKNARIEVVLNSCFKDQDLTYTIAENTIIVKRKLSKQQINVLLPSQTSIEIKGVITDDKGHHLEGATILVKGTNNGTKTDADGNFSINSEPNSTLVISFIGFETTEINIGNRTTLSVQLKAAATIGEQVIVIGYGTTKKATLTGSAAEVKGSEVVKSQAINVSNSIAGLLPGVTAVTQSGEPGRDGSIIRIRGANTLGDNGALIIVDGIPDRSLERIDPNSIETITVLKDASAAIYGSQAANGVILITTKRGKIGKPQVSVNLNQGFTQPTRIPKLTNAVQYATALNELDVFKGLTPRYTDEEIGKFADGSDPWKYPNTNWFDATFRKWSDQASGNVTITGGSETMKYFVSLGTKTQETQYKKSPYKYNQYDFRSNLDWTVNKYISLGLDVVGRLEENNFPTAALEYDGTTDIFSVIMDQKPNSPAYWPNGLPGPDQASGFNPVTIATNQTGYDFTKNYVLNSNLKLKINVPWIPGLSLTGNAAIDHGFSFGKRFTKPWYLYSWDRISYDADNVPILVKSAKGVSDPRLAENMGNSQNILLNGLLDYDKTIARDHHIKFLAGAESRKGKGDYFYAFRRYFVSTALDQLDAGGTLDMSNSGSGYNNARLNYFGRVNYNYKEKYLAEFVWRVDGSYIFPKAGRYGFFPGVSAGWRISEEKFWKQNLAFINNFKIRGSYGKTGNDRISEWQYLATYQFGPQYRNQVFNINNQERTLAETVIPNPYVTWEVATQRDIGIDATTLSDKLSVTFDYFDYLRSKILWNRNASIPTSTGLSLPRENIGKVSNKGFDFSISYADQSASFRYRISLNGGYQKNKIIFWDESPGAPKYQQSTGHPMNTSLFYEAVGIFHDQNEIDKSPHWIGARPGDIIFKDINGDGNIDAADQVRSDKTDLPTFQGGLAFNFEYKHFSLSILLQGSGGAARYVLLPEGDFGNILLDDFSGRWAPDNTDAVKPRTSDRNDYFRSNNNTYFLQNTDYVKLKNVEFGYNLSEKLTERWGIAAGRIYASGFNLLTYSPHFKDFDPEVSGWSSSMTYPVSRIINLGLSITF